MKSIEQILQQFPDLKYSGESNINITGLGSDSRVVNPGDIFAVIQGSTQDGARFIDSAVNRGIEMIITQPRSDLNENLNIIEVPLPPEKYEQRLLEISDFIYGYPSRNMDIIGITGTNGKTSTAFMIKEILTESGRKAGMIGTVGHFIEKEREIALNTTPPALELNRLLGRMKQEGIEAAVMEVSSYGLKINRTVNIKFSSAIFTSLGRDHLDVHPSWDDYVQSKLKLFSAINNDGFACFSAAIEGVDQFIRRLNVPVWIYGITGTSVDGTGFPLHAQKVDYSGKIINTDTLGSVIDIGFQNQHTEITINLPGLFNAQNALGAFCWAHQYGISPSVTAKAIAKLNLIPGRMERVKCTKDYNVFIDYAHTPDALQCLLSSVKSIINVPSAKLICVFGCGGDRDPGKRPLMGKIAEKYSDLTVITNDNPRNEDPREIATQISQGFSNPPTVILDRQEAIEFALSNAGKGDVVLICGKGHENYQIFKDHTEHFDDREIVKNFCGS